jgi:tetratricopeptide (TPR) repeat protein
VTESAGAQQPSEQREVRVFISSTFRDMQEERDELVKRIFPQLRKLCESRGVTWREVDLRWGITDEQTAEGKVLPICLAEIKGCRPFFLGLLGERYGWVPDEIDPAVIEQEPWLAEHRQKSVTELEILHGVLNDAAMADHAFFYLRDPSYADSEAALQEGPNDEEIADHGREEAERRAAERRQKLAALKERIRASQLPVRENYPDQHALGGLVLQDLTGVIDRLYPVGSEPHPLDREAAEHEAFAKSRRRVYIGRPAHFDALDAHVTGDGPPLVVLGESGSGKSALLANWGHRYRASAHDLVLLHFIGASTHSADWAMMVRRILADLDRRFRLGLAGLEIPDTPDALRTLFANVLHMAAAQGRVVLVLSALDQLEDRDGAPDLVWLPPEIPANVRIVLSTLPGRPLDELTKRGWPTLEVEPLEGNEREQLIVDYLAQYRRALSPARVRRIAAADQAANPLYLRVLLDELRVWGRHETLGERIDHYLVARTVDDLYEKVLERFEADYERDRPVLVRDAMSLLWAARRGLSEAELLDLLGSDGDPLPGAYWSPLYLAADQSLVNRSGLLGFFHDYLRRAVERRYLGNEEPRRAAHLAVADYFEGRDLGLRKVDELPWQLARAGVWGRLSALLADSSFFGAAWEADQYEVKAYWAQVESHSPHRLTQAYEPVLANPSTHADPVVWGVADLLASTGHAEEALALRAHIEDRFRRAGDRENLHVSLGTRALILYERGDLDEALRLLEEQERICRELGDNGGLQSALGKQALILDSRGYLEAAMQLLQEQERICRELGDKEGLKDSLGNQALILRTRGELDGAMALLEEDERICRELGSNQGLQASLGNQALIFQARGDLDRAMALFEEQERICRELGYKIGLQRSLGNQGLILQARGDLDGAIALFKDEEQICRELDNKQGLHTSLGNQANILSDRGDLDGAMALYEEEAQISRELENKQGLQTSLGNQGLILRARGDLDGAMALFEEKEQICRELDNRDGLQRSLGYQAVILRSRAELNEAMELLDEMELICRELGSPEGLATSLANRAAVLHDLRRTREALSLAEEAHQIAEDHGLTAVAQHIEPLLGFLRSQASLLPTVVDTPTPDPDPTHASAQVEIPIPHPRADPKRASELNRQYLEELAEWEALPWRKRRAVKKPERPTGI